MDYGTFFFANIVSVSVFTVCLSLLALNNPKVTGVKWFAGSMSVGLLKLILQGVEGKAPAVLSGMVANELYLISALMQMMGLRWFVHRKPLKRWWPFVAVAMAMGAYTGMFLGKVRYSGNLINLPFVAVCGATAAILFQYGRMPVSRVSGVIASLQTMVAGYRAWLTNLAYSRPWETVDAHTDSRWLYSLAAAAFLATCMVMCYLWHLVTELNKELAQLAHTDPLTGALNRRAMEEVARRESARSVRYSTQLCMIVLDIDDFKHINDSHGHAAGDCVLQALVREAKAMLRVNDLLARTGGEEFTILMPDTGPGACLMVAERLRQTVEALAVPFASGALHFTVSAGVAQFDASLGSWEGMMQRADAAMYLAKEHGRNAVVGPGESRCGDEILHLADTLHPTTSGA